MTTETTNNDGGGQMYFVFNGYLDGLRSDEAMKPPGQRREIPTVKELAAAVKVHEVTLHNIVNGKVKQLNIETMKAVLDELWRRGFSPKLENFIKYDPPGGNE